MNDSLQQREPAVLIGALMAAVTAVLNVAVVLNIVELDPEQRAAILAAVNSLALLATSVLIRQRVYAPATVARLGAGRTPT